MGSRVVDEFGSPWPADDSGLWSAVSAPEAACLGADGRGMAITAGAGDRSPYVQRIFSPALDLDDCTELRLWLRISLVSPRLILEAGADPADLPWQRRLCVERPDSWELQRLWLGDMPSGLRRGLGVLRLRCPAPAPAFGAAVDDLVAGTPEALRDAGDALLGRLDGLVPDVPAFFDVPPDQPPPYVSIGPCAVLPAPPQSGGDVVDNETAHGAYVRPRPQQLRLDYRIEAFAAAHSDRARITEAITAELARDPRLLVFDEPLALCPLEPGPLSTGPYRPPATPLYYRLLVPQETGPRRPYAFGRPLLTTGRPDSPLREGTPR
ncbi:hypothetical protein [Streptomyces liliifuscus]|uniref:Uncharacterized protein n=1 Tax=Streptomyces liliifuscus TaxID=2797636 RepID=A0A7T7L186_9ACTN|nr:hypothetical protein [Streptomyces liliifuscus]QQM44586.1 hypothetical protein JEQ17_37725 [Streptomyces liliifuscus]